MKRKKPYSPTRSKPAYWQTQDYTNQVFMNFRDSIIALAMSRFKWINLPRGCDPRYLEWLLIFEGIASIAYPKEIPGAFATLKAVQIGQPNMYGMPRAWQALSETGRTRYECDWSTGVLVLENRTFYPLLSKINVWARELADIHIAKLINRAHMRMPMAITAPQEKVFDVQNFYKQIMSGDPFVLGYDSFTDTVKTEMTFPNKRNEFIGDLLDEELSNAWNEIYRELGVKNLPYKAERLIEDEVDVTAQPAELAALSPLDMRREACRKLNERFAAYLDAPVSVVWNSDISSSNFNTSHDFSKLLGGDEE